MIKLQMKMILLAGLGALALLPTAKADEWNQRTVFTFSGPVEIPGQILPAGTYVFKLANSSTYRHIVQVFNKEENHVFATFFAIPDYRLEPSNKTIVKFEERAGSSPDALKAWFFPGKTYGHEFVYPKKEAVALAKANDTPVPSMPAPLTSEVPKPAVTLSVTQFLALNTGPLKAEEPTGEEVELAAAFQIAGTQAPAPDAQLPEQLPATASSMPVIGLIGLLSLGGAIVLRRAAVRAK